MARELLIPSIYGEDIGVIMEDAHGISFQYAKTFDAEGFPISPIRMPFDPNRVFNYYDAMPTKGLPGIFADSLPDSFGKLIIREYFKRKQGVSAHALNITPLEMLSYIGDDGIGAIEYTPMQKRDSEIALAIHSYAEEIDKFYSGKSAEVIEELLAHPSAGGARPKVLVLPH